MLLNPKLHIKPSQDPLLPHCIPAYPLPTNFPKDSFCFGSQLGVIIPMTQMH